ncbi:nuclear transport factor 2 family protein [Sphingobium sp. OAS761]|uniref:nuclear transport factor 2 family protein n=1 Tax=Sphingobium sp. OAS761 TaxID=2817901 RepID=UPI0020A02B8D|nr:nuclear transport factor 2 family protein [Sphingobium sp. OAS761]
MEDKIAIGELIARFAHCSDYCDWDALATLYTPDVETEMEGIPLRFRGIDEQIEHAKVSEQQTEGKNRHYNYNLFVTEENGEVQANYMFTNVNAGHQPMAAKIVVSGRMRDTVVKTDGEWKIARRFVRFDQDVNVSA